MVKNIIIDPEFESYITILTDVEYSQLEANVIADGCREPLSLWGDTLLDGHNRLKICKEHKIAYEAVQISGIATRQEALGWIIKNQLGRRNLTPARYSYLRGKRYEMEKKEHGARGEQKIDQNDPSSTAERIAAETGVSAPTVKRDAKFAQNVDSLAKVGGNEVRNALLDGTPNQKKATKKKVKDLAARVKDKPVEEAKKVIQQEISTASQPMRATTFSHGSVEYYTPKKYVDAARQVMGAIDLDPASCEEAQKNINAKSFYSKDDDGLTQEWDGCVWLNPPYSKTKGKSNQEIWSKKLEGEYLAGNLTSAVLLVKAALGYKWFEYLWHRWPVCFATERLSFIKSNGDSAGQSKQGTAFIYFGPDANKFKEVFSQFGRVIFPEV